MAYNNSKQKLISETLCRKKANKRKNELAGRRPEGLAERSKKIQRRWEREGGKAQHTIQDLRETRERSGAVYKTR
jgi:hypothetical protein